MNTLSVVLTGIGLIITFGTAVYRFGKWQSYVNQRLTSQDRDLAEINSHLKSMRVMPKRGLLAELVSAIVRR